MQLNLAVIQEYLPGHYKTALEGAVERGQTYNAPLLYTERMAVRSGQLYMANAENLPSVYACANSAWICVGTPPPEWRAGKIPTLCLQGEENLLVAYNAVQEVYQRLDAWDCRLRDALEAEEDFSLTRLIEIGSRMLENHIGVADQFLQVIFSSEIIPRADGGLEVKISEELFHAPLPVRERVKEISPQEVSCDTPFLSSLLWKGCQLYCCNLFPLGHHAGSVYVVARHRPFRESDFALADHFFAYFQHAFLKYLRMVGQTEDASVAALRRLLCGEPLDAEEAQIFALAPDEGWVCFRLQERRGQRPMPRDYMYATIRVLMPQAAYTVLHHNEIIGLLRVQAQSDSLGLLQEIVQRMGYVGGCSHYFRDLGQFTTALQQARYAARQSTAQQKDQPLCFFQDYILQYMLDSCTGKMPAEALFSKGFDRLLAYDEKHGTAYVKTLEVYLKNETNVTRTAEMLYIQRSSLLKRLDRIARLTGADLQDPDVRLYFRLCLRILERQKEREGL